MNAATMTPRPSPLLLLLAAAGCAGASPVPRAPPPDLPPLPRSSIVAVLEHRSELGLDDAQWSSLEMADAELQLTFIRLRAESAQPTTPMAGSKGPSVPAKPAPAGASGPGGYGKNTGPGSTTGGAPGAGGPGAGGPAPAGGPPIGPGRPDPRRVQAALEARLDQADADAFYKAELVLTPAQRERARELAGGYRDRLYERRELLRELSR